MHLNIFVFSLFAVATLLQLANGLPSRYFDTSYINEKVNSNENNGFLIPSNNLSFKIQATQTKNRPPAYGPSEPYSSPSPHITSDTRQTSATNPSMTPAPTSATNPSMAPAPTPKTNSSMAPAPSPATNPSMAPAPTPATNPSMAPAPTPATNPSMAPAPTPTTNSSMAPAPTSATNPPSETPPTTMTQSTSYNY